ncbi:thioredoxin family protein [Sphingosinicellaceae bacterium]|nr:thioredoxin family protein [Sphingosinicellaceae bacterium]
MTRFLTLLFALLLAAPVLAAPHVQVAIAAESATPAPGKPVTLALTFTPQPGWHTYWKNPGDAGLETQAKWTLPSDATAAPLRYPVPGTLLIAGLMNYVYERPSTLLADVAVPAGLAAGSAFPVSVKLDYLVCSAEMCVPESATVSTAATIGDGAPDPARATLFAAARRALPTPLAEAAHYSVRGGRLVVAVPLGALDRVRSAYFFPAADGIAKYSAPQTVTVDGDRLRIETAVSGTPTGAISGILRIDRAGEEEPRGFAVSATPGAVPPAGAALAAGAGDVPRGSGTTFLAALLLAVAGGVVLNVMPCVFPILSLKALSLAKGNVDGETARRDALAYAAGVVLVCTLLGGAILGLRAAGTQVGWAFQLQDSRVILLLLLLTTGIALNLAGLFEFATVDAGGALASKPGIAGSFWTGALAAFVATPCTGPFMAGALGAALVLPTVAGLAVFAGLGLGLALPFLAVAFIPAIRSRLPRPGAWMATLRRLLSVPMFLTALALAWVLGQQSGTDGLILGVGGALVLGLLLWWLGRSQAAGRPFWLSLGGAAVAAVVTIALLPPAGSAPAAAHATTALAAEPFSEARLAQLRAAGTPTFVYFTADWCLTCKVNERGALADADVARAFRSAGVRTLVGDWTSGDAAIGRFIEARGAAGVPLYLFYSASGEPAQLPQILTAGRLIEAARPPAAS